MPGGDRTGPMGTGSGTGRRMGYCAGYDHPGYVAGSRGGFARFRGRGHRHWFYATGAPYWARGSVADYGPYPQSEMEALKAQADMLKDELKAIEERIGAISKDQSSKEKKNA